ncbi:MAG TPA: Uma2 family endonuclease [Bryobacteraceae bacterium]|nr:Uma2 family endonuclease [Bryobacteraceae bacterium]
MRAATLVPVEEYLSTSYDPDCDYVDGQIVERNLGEKPHSRIQRKLLVYLDNRSKEFGIEALPEQRVQVSRTRFRVPDVTVLLLPQDDDPIITSPPHLCIEILSRKDTMEDMQERIEDYLRFGVKNIWIISPRLQKAYVATATGTTEATSGKLETKDPVIGIPLSAVFE